MKNVSWNQDDLFIRWFEDGILNVSTNCIDRHLPQRAKQTAIIWEPDDPGAQPRHITYEELHREVCRFANVLKAHGVKRDDRVTISRSCYVGRLLASRGSVSGAGRCGV